MKKVRVIAGLTAAIPAAVGGFAAPAAAHATTASVQPVPAKGKTVLSQLPVADLPVTCQVGKNYGPYHLMTNAFNSIGLTYNGEGRQATATSHPGDTYFHCIRSGPDGISAAYAIQNAYGNCLRMHDKSSGYAVYEEEGCSYSKTDEQWEPSRGTSSGRRIFSNYGRLLLSMGINCVPLPPVTVSGYPNRPGNCVNWIPETA